MPPRDLGSLLERARTATGDAAVARRALPLVDLTSLSGTELEADIDALCHRAVTHGTAAVCIYPRYVRQAKRLVGSSGVRVATVTNFPAGSDDILATAEETAAAAGEGADEIDIVAPISAIQEGDVGLIGDMVEACRAAMGPGLTLKIILETGVLERPELISAAARAAIMSGVDFLKTSTGKAPVNATLEAAATLLAACAEADGRTGFKAAGGIRTVKDAAGYLRLADDLLGAGWATPKTFRFGASGLLDDLLRELGAGEATARNSGY